MEREREFDPVFQAMIPLPLARLYARAFNAKGERERHDHAFHLLEASVKLAAAAGVGRYRSFGTRSEKVDRALSHLALPSLGQWLSIFREVFHALAAPPRPDSWAALVVENLRSQRREADLHDALAGMAKAAAYSGRIGTRLDLFDLLESLPSYRNAMSDAHGSIKADPAVYREATPSLIAFAHELLKDALLFGGGRLVFAEEVKVGPRREQRVVWMDLKGPTGVRRQPYEGIETSEQILPGRLYLEVGGAEHIPLCPLVHYQGGDLLDEVFFLNRARGGKGGIQFLSYTSGDFYAPGRDPQGDVLVAELRDLLSWALRREVDGTTLKALAEKSRSDAVTRGEIHVEQPGEAGGKLLGDFEILGELGRGGMAAVYLARQRSLARTVALKSLPHGLRDDPVAVARFRQEIRALSWCDHPNVVKVLQAGQVEGTYYYAMEFVDGGDLHLIREELDRYRSGGVNVLYEEHFEKAASAAGAKAAGDPAAGLPPAGKIEDRQSEKAPQKRLVKPCSSREIVFRIAEIVRDAARGVSHLHEHGIIHRDLKPQNIMVTRSDHRPVVMDLGLAKVRGTSQSLTLEKGSILGTLRYMPPEQLQRNMLSVDARADVYALGAVLYELACLRPMLDGDSEERLTAQILFEHPPPAQKVNPRIPHDLATVIAKATQKDPKDRYGSAAELADDLDCFVHGKAIAARPPTLGYLLKLFVRRHRAAVAVAGLTAVLFFALLGAWIVSLRSTWQRERQALVREKESHGVAQEALERTRESVTDLFLERANRAFEKGEYQRAALCAAAALRETETPEARGMLCAAYGRLPAKLRWSTSSGLDAQTVAFSPDGKLLAAGSTSGLICVWETEIWREEASPFGHEGPVLALAFSPKGRLLCSGGTDGTLRLWDVARSRQHARLDEGGSGVTSVAFSPNGEVIASGSLDGTLRLWDIEQRTLIAQLEGHGAAVTSVSFAPEGRLLASGSWDGTVRVWDWEKRIPTACLKGHTRGVTSVAYSPNGKLLASGSWDRTIRLWELPRESARSCLQGHEEAVTALVFLSPGETVASASWDRTIRLWDVTTGSEVGRLAGPEEAVLSLSRSPDGRTLASASGDATVRLWDVNSREERARLESSEGAVLSIAFLENRGVLASISDDHVLRLRDLATGRELARHRAPSRTDDVAFVGFSPDGNLLAWLTGDLCCGARNITSAGYGWWSDGDSLSAFGFSDAEEYGQAWARDNVRTFAEVLKAEDADRRRTVAVASSLKRAAWVSRDGTIPVWDIVAGQEVGRIGAASSRFTCVALDPDGNAVAAGTAGGSIALWDAVPAKERSRIEGCGGVVTSMAFSHDGRWLASTVSGNDIRLWDVGMGKELKRLGQHEERCRCLTFSPKGDWLAWVVHTGTIRIADLASGTVAISLPVYSRELTALAASPDARRLALGSSGLCVSVVDLPTGKELVRGEGRGPYLFIGTSAPALFSPRGTRVAEMLEDGSVCVRDVETGKEISRLEDTPGTAARALGAFSPDATLFVYQDAVQGLWLCDLAKVKEPRAFENSPPSGFVFGDIGVVFDPQGRWVAKFRGNSEPEDSIRFWDPATGKEIASSPEKSASMAHCFAASPDGKLLAWGTTGTDVCLWSVEEKKGVRTHHVENGSVQSVAFSPDGVLLAAGSDEGCRLWSTVTGEQAAFISPGHGGVGDVEFSADGSSLALLLNDQSIQLWDLAIPPRWALLESVHADVLPVALSPDGAVCAAASDDHIIRRWRIDAAKELPPLRGHAGNVVCVSFSHDGERLASASLDDSIRIWDCRRGEETRRLSYKLDDAERAAVVLNRDGSRVAVRDGENSCVWETETGQRIASLTMEEGRIHASYLGFSPGGRPCAARQWGKRLWLWVWDLETGRDIVRLDAGSDNLSGMAFSQNGKSVAVVSEGDVSPLLVQAWEVDTGRETARFPLNERFERGPIWNASGTRLAFLSEAGDSGKSLGVWEAQTGKEVARLSGDFTKDAVCVALDPAGGRVALGCGDGTIRLCNLADGSKMSMASGHAGAVTCLAFARQDDLLISGSSDATIRIRNPRREIAKLEGPAGAIDWIAASADASVLVCASSDFAVWRKRPSGWERAMHWEGTGASFVSLALSPDGRRLAIAADEPMLFDLERGERIPTCRGAKRLLPLSMGLSGDEFDNEPDYWIPAWAPAFDLSGALLSLADLDGTPVIVDLVSGREVCVLEGEWKRRGDWGETLCAAFSSDGARLALGDYTETDVWDTRTGKRLSASPVRAWNSDSLDAEVQPSFRARRGTLAFSPDGHRLISSAKDRTMLLSETATGKELARFRSPSGNALYAAFGAGGGKIIVLDSEKQLWTWDLGLLERTGKSLYSQVVGDVGLRIWGARFESEVSMPFTELRKH